ncbi:hypothetical protein B2A_09021 [mine drainage metagenome]|uniref:Uncharacterized protein n=1 Tax=mine drainage metagenome TaxID=410659 RepID=T0ZN38_9ZZZZ
MGFSLSGIFKKSGKGKKAIAVRVTNINIRWIGSVHTLPGLESEKREFEISIPFHNRSEGAEMIKNALGSSIIDDSVSIKDISVDPPFKLLGIDPKPPIELANGKSMDFRLRVEAPEQNYSGPMQVRFADAPKEKVRVEINRVTLVRDGKRVDVENSELIMELGKGQMFKNSIQMYKILSLNDVVNRVAINKPFEFVSSDPKLPFKVDNGNSYIVVFYIQAPATSYAGPLELTLYG